MIKNDYSKSAKYYDLILGDYSKNVKFIEKLLKENKIRTVLEIGCGSGLYTIPLKKSFDIEGLDISKEMLLEAKKAIQTKNISKRYD